MKLLDGSWHTRETVVRQYKNLVHKVARRMAGDQYDKLDDYSQEGFIGLIKAFDYYDQAHGVKFITYAHTHIRGGIINYIRTNGSIHTPAMVKDKARKLDQLDAWEESDDTIRKLLQCSALDVEKIRTHKAIGTVRSLDKQLHNDDDHYYYLGITETDYTVLPIFTFVADLDMRKRRIVYLRAEGYTLKEIGARIGMSQERVRQLLNEVKQEIKEEELQWQ